MKKNRKLRPAKEPSLFIKLMNIYFEQARRRKALRTLQRQSWSFDFLALLLVKASRMAGKGLSLVIHDREGKSYTLTYDSASGADSLQAMDDSIFDHLDDEAAVSSFIAKHSVR